jgi:hypothetical protein
MFGRRAVNISVISWMAPSRAEDVLSGQAEKYTKEISSMVSRRAKERFITPAEARIPEAGSMASAMDRALINTIQAAFTSARGKTVSAQATEEWIGTTAHPTRANGSKTNVTDTANISTNTVKSLKDSGKTENFKADPQS